MAVANAKRRKSGPLKIAKAARLKQSARNRIDVTREEYNHIIEVLNERGEIINGLRKELEVQFKRMAQIQSELDEVRRAWIKHRNEGQG